MELGAVLVEDPFQNPYRPVDKPKAQLQATANIRTDVFMYLRKHDKIKLHHWTAAMRLSGHLERLTLSAPAIDPTAEPVDGRGAAGDPFIKNINARLAVNEVRAELGRRDFEYIRSIIEDPFSWILLYDTASPWNKKRLVERVIGILEILAGHFRYSGRS